MKITRAYVLEPEDFGSIQRVHYATNRMTGMIQNMIMLRSDDEKKAFMRPFNKCLNPSASHHGASFSARDVRDLALRVEEISKYAESRLNELGFANITAVCDALEQQVQEFRAAYQEFFRAYNDVAPLEDRSHGGLSFASPDSVPEPSFLRDCGVGQFR